MSASTTIPITPEQPYAVPGNSDSNASRTPSVVGVGSASSAEDARTARRSPTYHAGSSRTTGVSGESAIRSPTHSSTAGVHAARLPDRGAAVPVAGVSGTGGVYPGAARSGVDAEVFNAAESSQKTYTRFTPRGRLTRCAQPFASDLSVGKFGVLAEEESDLLEIRLLRALSNDELLLGDKSSAVREEFLRVLHLFLAINSGSIGNVTGRMGVKDDSQPLRFGDVELAAADVATILGDKAYSYMRARASRIRDTIESAFATASLPDAELVFPGVCRAVDLIKVVAAAKGLSQYPQYAAVGSQYASGTPPYLITLIMESAAKVLNTVQGNVRASDGPPS